MNLIYSRSAKNQARFEEKTEKKFFDTDILQKTKMTSYRQS